MVPSWLFGDCGGARYRLVNVTAASRFRPSGSSTRLFHELDSKRDSAFGIIGGLLNNNFEND